MALSTIFQYLKLVPGVVKAGGGRIVAFFTSSWYSYFGMFAFVIYDHLNTLFSLKFTETFVDVGTKLGKADAIIAENLTYLATNASGIGYITTLIQVFVAFFTVLWFVRTVGTILRFSGVI